MAGFDVIGTGLFDFGIHAGLFEILTDSVTETPTIEYLGDAIPAVVEDSDKPCDKCTYNKRSRYCCSTTTKIGNDCSNCTVLIKGYDIDALVKRIRDLEEYIVARELERQVPKLPSELAVMITRYF
jgi:hypothetical protein